jgi:UDP-glucose 4-epimerase
MLENILVTGGAGFIGANIVRLLLDEGHRVRVLDNFSAGCRRYLDGLELEIMEGDILDTDAVAEAIDGMNGVVHLAAQTGVPSSLEDPYHDCETNVIGTLNMLEASQHAGVERFVFASSNAPLGRQEPPVTEDKAPLPIAPYGASKLAGEGYCLAWATTRGCPY